MAINQIDPTLGGALPAGLNWNQVQNPLGILGNQGNQGALDGNNLGPLAKQGGQQGNETQMIEEIIMLLEQLLQQMTGQGGAQGAGGAQGGGGGAPDAGGGGGGAPAAAGGGGGGGGAAPQVADQNQTQGAGGGNNPPVDAVPGNAPTQGLQGVLNKATDIMNHPNNYIDPNTGNHSWDGYCLGFVNQATGGKDPDLQKVSARDAMNAAQADGRLRNDWKNMPAGSAVFWGGGQYGHVAIYSGKTDGQGNPVFISTSKDGVKKLTSNQIGLGNPAGYMIPKTN